jgi:hypothetical protein
MIYDNTLHDIASILVECERLLNHPTLIDGEGARLTLDKCKLKLVQLVNQRQEKLINEVLNKNWPKRPKWPKAVNE